MKQSHERIPVSEPALGDEDIEYVTRALRSGWISGRGLYVNEFEERFAKWLGTSHAVTTSSGTTALHLALASLEIGPKDEVIIPAFSMAAIPFAVTYTGARSILVDSEWSTWNLDPNKIEEKITDKTKAIIVMHTYGHPVDMDPILKIAKRFQLYLIEDAAEAHGAEYKGIKVGSIGDLGCFSFFANKIITTGEGGMVVTNDSHLAERAKILRNMAFDKSSASKFAHKYVGFNYRMTNIQAALGLAQMKRINKFIEIRRTSANFYNTLLKRVEGVSPPPEAKWAKNVYWMYSILVDEETYGLNRDDLMKLLIEKYSVETRPFFVPIHRQPVYQNFYQGQRYGVAEKLSAIGLNLPSSNTLTKEQIERVADGIISLSKK